MTEAGEEIRRRFGPEYHRGPRAYTTKSKLAQEAHEASLFEAPVFRDTLELAYLRNGGGVQGE